MFENETKLSVHLKKHQLKIKMPDPPVNPEIRDQFVDETPTPSRFLKNFSKVPTDFLDSINAEEEAPASSSPQFSINHNTFADTFRRASFSSVPKLPLPEVSQILVDENSGSLNTPSITINPATKSPEAPKQQEVTVQSENIISPSLLQVESDQKTKSNGELTSDRTREETLVDSPPSALSDLSSTVSFNEVLGSSDAATKKKSRVFQGNLKKILPKLPNGVKVFMKTSGGDLTIPITSLINVPIVSVGLESDTFSISESSATLEQNKSEVANGSVQSSQPSSSQGSNCSQSSNTSSQSTESNGSAGSGGSTASQTGRRGRKPKVPNETYADKSERHKVRNRQAAMRCREKRKMWKSNLSSSIEDLRTLKEKLTVSMIHPKPE